MLNGGFLTSPDEFFTSDQAQQFFEKRLRYIVGRWGYSCNIVFWELWNEVDLTGYYDTEKVRDWHRKIIPRLREMDPWKHPVTIHYCRRDVDPLVWVIPEIETIVGNAYAADVVTSMRNYYLKRALFGKPMMVHEYGVGGNRTLLENNLHAGIWASSMTPMFGTALFWWWPFLDHFGLYTHYRGLSRFWEGEDRRGKNLVLSDASVEAAASGRKPPIQAIGIQNDTSLYLWVYDPRMYDTRPLREKGAQYTGTRVTVRGIRPGEYRVECWDPGNGTVVSAWTQTLKNRKETVRLPGFEGDIAVKVKPVEKLP